MSSPAGPANSLTLRMGLPPCMGLPLINKRKRINTIIFIFEIVWRSRDRISHRNKSIQRKVHVLKISELTNRNCCPIMCDDQMGRRIRGLTNEAHGAKKCKVCRTTQPLVFKICIKTSKNPNLRIFNKCWKLSLFLALGFYDLSFYDYDYYCTWRLPKPTFWRHSMLSLGWVWGRTRAHEPAFIRAFTL